MSWGHIAASTGYYDQAHLIAEFRAIAGVTPRALLGELGEPAMKGRSARAVSENAAHEKSNEPA